MNKHSWSLVFALAAPMMACGSAADTVNPAPIPGAVADSGVDVLEASTDATDASDASDAGDSAPSKRSMLFNPLFGDTLPQNLFLDPTFSVRMAGVGNWQAQTADTSTATGPVFGSYLLSDSPAGLGMLVGHLGDATDSGGNFELSLVAQVPGGPGPYHLSVWISTLDASASTSLSGVTVGLLVAMNSTAIQMDENAAQAKVLGGRTWHRFDGELQQSLALGGFVVIDFAESPNTWLMQSPEFIPTALEMSTRSLSHAPQRALPRPMTAREKQLVDHYVHTPRLSVPASHPSLAERPRDQWRR